MKLTINISYLQHNDDHIKLNWIWFIFNCFQEESFVFKYLMNFVSGSHFDIDFLCGKGWVNLVVNLVVTKAPRKPVLSACGCVWWYFQGPLYSGHILHSPLVDLSDGISWYHCIQAIYWGKWLPIWQYHQISLNKYYQKRDSRYFSD